MSARTRHPLSGALAVALLALAACGQEPGDGGGQLPPSDTALGGDVGPGDATAPSDGQLDTTPGGDIGPDTVVPPDTVSPDDTAIPPETSPDDTAVPPDTVIPDDTAVPPDTVIPDDTAIPPDTVTPDDTSVPPDTVIPDDTAVPDDTSVPPDTAPGDTVASDTAGDADTAAVTQVLINEVVYDVPGGDGNPGTGVFVELWGPPGTALDGYALAGVNGAGGATYVTIPLSGAVGADGYFVVAHPNAAEGLLAVADLLDDGVDLQNGPDSLQLRAGDTVVDALGYGTFSGDAVFAGEGQPAPEPPDTGSLSRDGAHTDTDDNLADFAVASPSPGADPPACADACDASGATECTGGDAVATCAADWDADPCLEWGPPVACPDGESCSEGACAAPPCEDACPGAGATACADGSVTTCAADWDADPCLEWGGAAPCDTGLVCTPAGDGCAFPALPGYLWSVHAGADKNDWTTAVATSLAGDVFAAGIFTGPFTLGPEELTYGNTDIFLTQISPDGQIAWARDIGGGAVDQLQGMAVAANGDVVISGWYDGSTTIGGTTLSNGNSSWDAFVARYTADGDPVWARKFTGDGDNECMAVAADPVGGLYVAGVYEEWFELSAGYALLGNAFVAKLDADGGVAWSFGIGGPEADLARGVAVDANGDVVVTGVVGSLVDFDPSAGEATGGPGLFVAKYGPGGQYLWHLVKSGGSAAGVAVDGAGRSYVVGSLTGATDLGGGWKPFGGGSSDGFLMKVSAGGAYMWSSRLASPGTDRLRAVDVDPLGNALVTGEIGGATVWQGVPLAYAGISSSLDEDAVIARFRPDGTLDWASRLGGPGQEWGQAISADPTGHVAWGGHFEETITLNGDTLTSQGYGDLAVARFTATADGSPGCFDPAAGCSGHGACSEVDGVPTCACAYGYAGASCDECAVGFALEGSACVSVCAGEVCPAHQHCEAPGGTPTCACDAGWTGADCDTCAPGYATPSPCFGDACVCLPDCYTTAPGGQCADCAGALELWPGEGSLKGFLVGDGKDATGGCGSFGGAGPDHALTFTLTETTRVEMTLSTTAAVVYLRGTCDDPETQLACDAPGGSLAGIVEVLPPGSYTAWLDTNDGTGSSYTLGYSFRADPCVDVTCAGDLVCATEDWLATACACPPGTEPAGGDACTPIIPPLELDVTIGISNTCDLSVSPEALLVPAGQTAEVTFTNTSVDYHAHLDATPGVDNLSLPMGESWLQPYPWCIDGVSGWVDISVSEGCGSIHRLHVTCLAQ